MMASYSLQLKESPFIVSVVQEVARGFKLPFARNQSLDKHFQMDRLAPRVNCLNQAGARKHIECWS